MTRCLPVLAALLLAGCNATPQGSAPAPAAPAAAATAPAPPAATKHAAASGVVQSIDAAARTVTIAHGPIEAIGWPGMTMTFHAPDTDLSTLAAGDRVAFEFDLAGADATLTAITRQ